MVLWRKRQENFKECNAIKHKSRKTLKRVLWLLLLYKIVVFPSCSDIQKNLVYMLYLEWYDAKYIKKSRSFQKQCVFPLFSKKKKKQLRFVVTAWFLMWTSLGLNQGPPDYESVALTNWATSPMQNAMAWHVLCLFCDCKCTSIFWIVQYLYEKIWELMGWQVLELTSKRVNELTGKLPFGL